MHRILKQLLYGLFYLACWALFGLLVYFLFLKPAPSCFDNIHNQSESGVDCGGPCATECTPSSLAPLAVRGSVLIFPVDTAHVSILALVTNPNTDEAAKSFGYAFTLSRADGTKITSLSGTSYAYAGEGKYLALPNVFVAALPAHIDLALTNPVWVRTTEFQKPKLTIQNFATTISPFGSIEVDGRITNQDVTPFDAVDVVAVFYSNSGIPMGVSETQITNLGLDESRAFTILEPNIPKVSLAATKIFLYTEHP